MLRRLIAACLGPLLLASCAAPIAGGQASPVTVGVLAINDFHGALEPPHSTVAMPDGKGGTMQVPAGGAAWLASAIEAIRSKYANHVTVSAGDLISASQFASALFLDEPTIGVMNRIGLDFNAVGNHEFDRGGAELLRMQNGGCAVHASRKPCRIEHFTGARFQFLSASTRTTDGSTLFPATGIKRFGTGRRKVSVGFIGLTLRATPTLVMPLGVAGLSFGDEADAINAAVPRLKRQGADAIVVLIHQGGRTLDPQDPNGCNALSGDILPILARLDRQVDVVISGHTHWAYVCDYGTIDHNRPLLLTSAGVYGKLVTNIALEIDPAAHRVVAKRAVNVVVQSEPFGSVPQAATVMNFSPNASIAAYVKRYTDAARAEAQRPAGRLAGPADGAALAYLIADAQLGATRFAGAQIALTNPFGVRVPLKPAADGSLTFGELFRTQPFDNRLVTQTMTGAELRVALEQGLDATGPEQPLAPSEGFAYRFDRNRPPGQRIVEMTLNGEPIGDTANYRVTTNAFLSQGGDGFTAFSAQRGAVTGNTDVAALEAWLSAGTLRKAPAESRVASVAQ